MTLILLTNDDGIGSPGLTALENAFARLGEVWVVAPNSGVSACGRAVSLNRPLRITEHGNRRFSVDGTPTDCVLLACRHLMPSVPDVVVSGINDGFNIGEDLDYSGTVAGALEGALQGSQCSIAASIEYGASADAIVWAARTTSAIADAMRRTMPPRVALNLNFPAEPTPRLRFTRQGDFLGTGTVEERTDPRGKTYYWIGHRPHQKNPPADSDRGALAEGRISATLVSLDRTFHGAFARPEPVAGLEFE
jgi:5'-nucleotidase